MQYLSGRMPHAKVACESRGNVIWLTFPARGPKRRPSASITSLPQSIAALAREIERSGKLNSDIAAAVDAGRYERYKVSMSGPHEDRMLAGAQRLHLTSLLKFVHATAAAGSDARARENRSAARLDTLAGSIRELQASLERARELSRTMLQQSQRRDWRGSTSPFRESGS
ncbi:MAG TPA: hypothetical protein VJ738_10285 [Steroidobacteraceae bacterium]|nr:hypothetical protein [Steroidobacteraceae bacterium]